MKKYYYRYILLISVFLITFSKVNAQFATCNSCAGITTFIVDLSSKPDSTWISPVTGRNGKSCCAISGAANQCIRFIITTSPLSTQLSFNLLTAPIPPGQQYSIDCGALVNQGTTLCIPPGGTHCVIYCKPGNDIGQYGLTVSKGIAALPDMSVTSSCNKTMTLSGGNDPSISWRSITGVGGVTANGVYNSNLSCTSGCASTTFTAPAFGSPLYTSYIDFEVSKLIAASACTPAYTYKDTVRITLIQKTQVYISPPTASICFADMTTTITANPSFGTPPYTYLWSNGATTQNITVPAGNYTVQVSDVNTNAGCSPSVSAGISVAKNTGPNIASTGGDTTICAGSTVALNGSVTSYDALGNPVVSTTSGGTWSGGTGTYAPNANTPNAVYTPSATEVSAGTVTLTLTTTNNGGCPAVSSQKTITILSHPTANAGSDQALCKNNTTATLAGAVTNATSFSWTSSSGCAACFSNPASLTSTYKPSTTDTTNGSVTLTLTAVEAGCANATSSMKLTFTPIPSITASAAPFCLNIATIQLKGTILGPSGTTAYWSGNGGTFSPNNTDLNAIYTPSALEKTIQSSGVYFIANYGNCKADTVKVNFSATSLPVVDAGPNRTVCANNLLVKNITGTITGASLNPQWTSPTGGTFSPIIKSGTSYTTNYTFTKTDSIAGSVILTFSANIADTNCTVPISDTMTITMTNPPTVNAGADQSVCFNNANVALNGFSSTGAGTWSGGAGTFNPNNTTLNAIYTPTAGEKGTGVTLTLTSSNNGLCNAVTDQMAISVTPAPTVFAGAAKTSCANNPTVSLSDATSSTGSGQWSGGAGVFTPSATALNPTYTPSATEIATGNVTLTLTTTNNINCNAVSSNVLVTINLVPTVTLSSGITICADNPVANLTATVVRATGVVWSGGAGTYAPDNISLNTAYTPSAGEISAGTVTLTATTTGNGLCNAVAKTIPITIAPTPTANAGADQVLCGAVASASINGAVTGAGGGIWTTSGTGTFGNASALSTTYTPSAADKATGIVTLTLTTTGMAPCAAVTDQMNISFTVIPTINAGPDQAVCSNDFPVTLNGSGSPATWVGGAGVFSPNRGTMSATYTPTAGEIGTTVTLTLTTNAAGACPQVSDAMSITVSPAPVANPGAPFTVCGNSDTINLSGSVTNAAGGVWTTAGTGTIANAAALVTTYTPSATDKTNGSVTFTLTTTGNNNCSAASANLVVTISPQVTVFAGPDQTLCNQATPPIALNGNITGATGGTWTIVGGGAGVITNATSATTATYTPNIADISVTLRLTTTGNPIGCAALSDDLILTLIAKPTVNANTDQTACSDVAFITLNGSSSTGTGSWATTGAGTFNPNNTTLNAQYIPAAADAGTVLTFTLSTTGAGPCSDISDQMTVTLTPKPTINAGTDQTKCANNSTVTLLATINTAATGGTWTTAGDGNFSGISGTGLGATYTPGPNDISNGAVNLTVTTTGMGSCNAVSDVMVVNFTAAPTINAGPDRVVCANNNNVVLLGTETTATGGTWTALAPGSGSFSSISANGMNATYTPSAADNAATSVQLMLTSTNNGTCNAVTDTMLVTITPAPTVSVTPSFTICADSFYVNVNAITTVAIAGIWTSSSGGSFFASPALNASQYVPTATDRTNGSVQLTYTTTSQGACSPVSAFLTLTIAPSPTITASISNSTICATTPSVTVTAVKTVATGVKWTTSGSGTFGSSTSLSTTYAPSAIDIAAGSVILTCRTTGSPNSCKEVGAQVTLTIIPPPTVNLGANITQCASTINTGITLNPILANVSNVTWSSSGTGSFVLTTHMDSVKYFPSVADTSLSSITVKLNVVGISACSVITVSSSKVITIQPTPIVNAGPDQTICDGSNVSLNGEIVHSAGGTWTTSGSGSFSPNANTLNATYVPSAADNSAGSITLMLSSTAGTCGSVSDNLFITFQGKPVVNAGTDQTVCFNKDTIMLVGSMSNSVSGLWTSTGAGTFTPGNTFLNVGYAVTAADRANGQVVFTLASTGAAPCANVSDNVIVHFQPLPTANIGPSFQVCAITPNTSLGATITNAAGGTWTSSGDGSFNNANILNPVYTFGPTDPASGGVIISFSTTGNGACAATTVSLTITFVASITMNAGPPTQTVCLRDIPTTLQGSGGAGLWSTSGDGTFSNPNQLTSTYTPGVNDLTLNTVTLTLTSLGACPGTPGNIVLNYIPGYTLNAGPNVDICTDIPTVTMAATANPSATAFWTTTGSGSFSDNTPNAVYTLSPSDIASGNVKNTYTIPSDGVCNAASDTMRITIHQIPTVSAGTDKNKCANLLTSLTLDGSHSIATGVQWTKLTNAGVGSLTSSTSDVATYTPDPSDVGFGTISFQINTTGNGFCSGFYSDTMNLIITPAPTVNIGPDSTICAGKTVQLLSKFTVATGGNWSSSGTGTFSPDVTNPAAVYTPSVSDIGLSNVILSFTTTGNGICTAVSGSKKISITPKPTVNAGADFAICSGQVNASLSGSATNTPSILWRTTGTGTFTPSNTTLSGAAYVPSALDKLNGGVTISLSSTGIAECDTVTDYLVLTIFPNPSATVYAGANQLICSDQSFAQLDGVITIATLAKWDCQGSPCSGQFSPNDTDLNAKYLPSASDKSTGSLIIRLTTIAGNGICTPVFGEMTLTIMKPPVVNAGSDQTYCADADSIQLKGLITPPAQLNPPGYSWVSTGSGIFAPNAFVSNPEYIPTTADISKGTVGFTLTSTNNGTCQAYSNGVNVNFTPKPTVNAGADQIACANKVYNLSGTQTVSTVSVWTSTGTGVINTLTANGLDATYTFSAADTTAGVVFMKLTNTLAGLGTCKPTSDTMKLTINHAPFVKVGPDHQVCANTTVPISGTILNTPTGTGLWTTTGSGTFSPSVNSLNATYSPSSADTSSKSVNIILTSTANGICAPEEDTLTITFVPVPVVNAGSASICKIINGSQLNGTIANAVGGKWTATTPAGTPATGTFAPNAFTLNAVYYPSLADFNIGIAGGLITLTLQSQPSVGGVCAGVSKSTTLSITNTPIANAGPDISTCNGSNVTLSAALFAGNTIYEWKQMSTGTIVNPNATSITVPIGASESYILTTYNSKNCPSDADTVNIESFNMPTASITGTSCFTDSNSVVATIVNNPPVPPLPLFQWLKNDTIMSGQLNTQIRPNSVGTYQFNYTFSSCKVSSNTFTINPSPIIAGIDKTNCVNNVTTLSTSATVGDTYSWTSNAPMIPPLNNSSVNVQNNNNVQPFDTLSYSVKATNGFGCSTSDSVYLISVASPIMALKNDTLCANATDLLDATPINFGVAGIPPIESYFPTYTWTKDGVNLNHNAKTLLVTQAGKYIVNINIGDCNNNKDSSTVIYNQSAVINLPQSTKFCAETDSFAVLNATAKPVPGYTFSYLWKPNGDTTAITDATTAAYYFVTVTSKIGTNSCPVKDSILVKNICPPRLFVPNVITPDKDGNNKTFRIFGGHYTNFSIIIFSRWGEIIFASENLEDMQNVGWDGTYKGEPMPEGVYSWIVKYEGETDENKGPYKKEGEVLILR